MGVVDVVGVFDLWDGCINTYGSFQGDGFLRENGGDTDDNTIGDVRLVDVCDVCLEVLGLLWDEVGNIFVFSNSDAISCEDVWVFLFLPTSDICSIIKFKFVF